MREGDSPSLIDRRLPLIQVLVDDRLLEGYRRKRRVLKSFLAEKLIIPRATAIDLVSYPRGMLLLTSVPLSEVVDLESFR